MQKTTTEMDCGFIRNNLFSYQEKQLSGDDNRRFEEHLHLCKACTLIYSGFQSVETIMVDKKSAEPDPFICTRTINRIEAELEKEGVNSFMFFIRKLQPALVSLILLFAILIGYSIGRKIDAKYSAGLTRQNDIRSMKADLYIPDFMDESNTFFDNH